MKWALLAVCGLQSESSELLLVKPLAFSNLALARLEGTFLIVLGGSGVEVLLICALHWSLLVARAFCWLSKLFVTALSCCSVTVWIASCIVKCTIATSGKGEYSVLAVRLPDSGGCHELWPEKFKMDYEQAALQCLLLSAFILEIIYNSSWSLAMVISSQSA